MTDLLTQLLSRCKCEVVLTVNEHRGYYQTPEEKIDELYGDSVELADDIRDGILRTGNVVELHFFPRTPLLSYTVIHYDVNEAIREALALLDVENMP